MNIFKLPNRDELGRFCIRWQIAELSIFGSALRGDFSSESDVDLLVTFQAGAHPTLFKLVEMKNELARIFGRPIDLVSRKGLEKSANYLRRSEILSTAKSIYAAAA